MQGFCHAWGGRCNVLQGVVFGSSIAAGLSGLLWSTGRLKVSGALQVFWLMAHRVEFWG